MFDVLLHYFTKLFEYRTVKTNFAVHVMFRDHKLGRNYVNDKSKVTGKMESNLMDEQKWKSDLAS